MMEMDYDHVFDLNNIVHQDRLLSPQFNRRPLRNNKSIKSTRLEISSFDERKPSHFKNLSEQSSSQFDLKKKPLLRIA